MTDMTSYLKVQQMTAESRSQGLETGIRFDGSIKANIVYAGGSLGIASELGEVNPESS